jgi:hypothetical protein
MADLYGENFISESEGIRTPEYFAAKRRAQAEHEKKYQDEAGNYSWRENYLEVARRQEAQAAEASAKNLIERTTQIEKQHGVEAGRKRKDEATLWALQHDPTGSIAARMSGPGRFYWNQYPILAQLHEEYRKELQRTNKLFSRDIALTGGRGSISARQIREYQQQTLPSPYQALGMMYGLY